MKKFIPIIIAVLAFAISVVLTIEPLRIAFMSNKSAIIYLVVVLALGLAVMISLFLLLTSNQKRRNKVLKERLKMWTDLSFFVNKAGDEVFNELPIGVLIYDSHLEVKWANPYSEEIFQTKKVSDEELFDLSEQLEQFVLSKKQRTVIEIKGEVYDVINRVESNFLYLFNATEREQIKLRYQNHLPTMGIIYFDNLAESLSSLDVSEQSSLKGRYLAAVDDWLTKYNAYLKPYSDDKLIFMTYKKDLDQMVLNKFEILEAIRNISIESGVRVSLSVGIASWDVPFEELGVLAQNAIDLAEKRGGDQVVVNIENKKIEYFGAKSDASAKSSKVSARVNAQTIRDYIKKASQVYVMGHNQSDLDSFGSMLAVYLMARVDNKHVFKVYDESKLDLTVSKVLAYSEKNYPEHIIFDNVLTEADAISNNDEDTLLIIVDTQSPKIVMCKDLLDVSKNLLIIDHHRASDDGFDAMFSYIEPYASSTIELVMELISFYDDKTIKVSPLESSIMYGGLVLDTANFTTRTGVRTFEVAQKLRELEADPALVKSWLRKDLKRTLVINRLMSNAEVYLDRFVFIKTNEELEDRVILAQISSESLSIEGVDAAFTIALIDGVASVSARSNNDINVQLVMEHIGGGGHLNSAAAQLKNTSVNEVYKQIKEYLEMEYGTEGEEMNIILLEDVKGRGKKDDVIKVAPGYANFLISSGKALIANDENLKILNDAKQAELERQEQHLNLMNKLKADIESHSVTVEIQIGEGGKLFGSVTSKLIAEEFEKQNGILIDRKKIDLPTGINSVGIYTATVSLHPDVKANLEINVIEKQV